MQEGVELQKGPVQRAAIGEIESLVAFPGRRSEAPVFRAATRVGILAGHFLSEGQTRAKPHGQTFGGPQLSQGHTASRSLPHVAATCLCVGERRGAPRLCAPGLCRGQCPSRPRLLPFGVWIGLLVSRPCGSLAPLGEVASKGLGASGKFLLGHGPAAWPPTSQSRPSRPPIEPHRLAGASLSGTTPRTRAACRLPGILPCRCGTLAGPVARRSSWGMSRCGCRTCSRFWAGNLLCWWGTGKTRPGACKSSPASGAPTAHRGHAGRGRQACRGLVFAWTSPTRRSALCAPAGNLPPTC